MRESVERIDDERGRKGMGIVMDEGVMVYIGHDSKGLKADGDIWKAMALRHDDTATFILGIGRRNEVTLQPPDGTQCLKIEVGQGAG